MVMTLEETNNYKRAVLDDVAAGNITPVSDAETAPEKRKCRGRKKKETPGIAGTANTPAGTYSTPISTEAETVPRHSVDNVVLHCSCGADIMPDDTGMYPDYCPECHTENDYRGVDFLRNSPDILVCDRCGHLTPMPANKCRHCGWDGS